MNRSTLISTIATDICTGCGVTAATMDSVLDDIANNCIMPEDLAGTGSLAPLSIPALNDGGAGAATDNVAFSPNQISPVGNTQTAAVARAIIGAFIIDGWNPTLAWNKYYDPSSGDVAMLNGNCVQMILNDDGSGGFTTGGLNIQVSSGNYAGTPLTTGWTTVIYLDPPSTNLYLWNTSDDGTGCDLQINGTISVQGNAGWSGTFQTGDGRTATVTNGIITGVA